MILFLYCSNCVIYLYHTYRVLINSIIIIIASHHFGPGSHVPDGRAHQEHPHKRLLSEEADTLLRFPPPRQLGGGLLELTFADCEKFSGVQFRVGGFCSDNGILEETDIGTCQLKHFTRFIHFGGFRFWRIPGG